MPARVCCTCLASCYNPRRKTGLRTSTKKCILRIILGSEYESYDYALNLCNIKKLEARKDLICIKFATNAVKHKKFQNWFVPKPRVGMRNQKSYITPIARTERFKKSPIYSLINIINQRSSK